jgi:AraC family transcriptional regulator
VHEDPEREVASGWAIAFVRAGTFDVIAGGARHRLVEGSVFLTAPGLEFRCQHHTACPDDVCLSVAFGPPAVSGAEDAWARSGWIARAVPTPRLALVQRRLAGAVGDGDRFAMERWAIAGVTALEADTRRRGSRGHYTPRAADIEAVIATCRAIEADPAAQRSIAERARAVGQTSTGITHFFRRYLGTSPHQYVVRCRLVAAAALLDDGAGVSETALRSGFENLSHFCRVFQRTFAVRASRWRTLQLRERRRKVQALLGGLG